MKKLILIFLAFTLTTTFFAQSVKPVYIKDGKFYIGCNKFFPKVCAYNVSVIYDWFTPSDTLFFITPRRDYFDSLCVPGIGCYPYGFKTGIKYIKQHLEDIKSLGLTRYI